MCRLRRDGLRGFYIHSQVLEAPRYLHVKEAALLLTIPQSVVFPGPRSGLCLVGQVAAPMQALWVASHLVRATQKAFGLEPLCDPEQLVRDFKQSLLFERHHLWETAESHATRHVHLLDEHRLYINVLREGLQHVHDLIQAERALHPTSHITLWDGPFLIPLHTQSCRIAGISALTNCGASRTPLKPMVLVARASTMSISSRRCNALPICTANSMGSHCI